MTIHPNVSIQVARERQRDMLAQADQQRLTRPIRDLARASRQADQAMRPVIRRFLRIRRAVPSS